MEVRHERQADGMTTIEIEVPADTVNEIYQKALKDLKRHVNVPGFRRGKVPPRMVEAILGPEAILDYAKERLEEQVYPEALKSLPALVTLDQPQLELKGLERDQPCEMTIKVLTAAVDIGDYEGLAVEQFRATVTEEDAQAELDRYHQQQAQFEEADHTDLRMGDWATFALRIVRDGTLVEEYNEDEPLRIELGNNQLNPNIDEHLIGLAAGQSTTFEVQYPEDYDNEDLRGATAEFTVELFSVETRESLEAMLARMGVEDAASMLASVQERLGSERGNLYRIMAREAAVQQLLDRSRIDIPRAHLQAEVMEAIENFEEELEQRGVDLDELDDEVREREEEQIRQRTEFDAKRDVLLRAISQTEALDLSPDDLMRELSMISAYSRVEPRLMLRRLEESGEMPRVAMNARIRKAAEFVYERAEVTEVDPPEGEDDHDHDHEGHDHGHEHHHGTEPATPAAPDEDAEGSAAAESEN